MCTALMFPSDEKHMHDANRSCPSRGTLQWLAGKGATFFCWALKVSGTEAVVASTSPFFGQGESVMLIKPFIAHLTMAELHQVMSSGFATIAGSVLVAFIALGVSGTALISSCKPARSKLCRTHHLTAHT